MGFISFFENFVQIFVLLVAWLMVLVAFFILAVQLFVTLIEFKLTTLAGFVLVPFGLFNKTAFLAEKVLGNVVASGVKVLVLAVIVGIGTTCSASSRKAFAGGQPTLEEALSLVLAALALLGLGIFGPGIATGLVSGRAAARRRRRRRHGLAVGGTALAGAGALGLAGAERWLPRRARPPRHAAAQPWRAGRPRLQPRIGRPIRRSGVASGLGGVGGAHRRRGAAAAAGPQPCGDASPPAARRASPTPAAASTAGRRQAIRQPVAPRRPRRIRIRRRPPGRGACGAARP